MDLPPHRKLICQGIDIYGVKETCLEAVEEDSPFPLCCFHRLKIQRMPRARTCPGAMTFDSAMRPVRVSCSEATGGPQERLCARCAEIEKEHEARTREQFREECPTCGSRVRRQRTPPAVQWRPRENTPPSGSRQDGGGQTTKYPPKTTRVRFPPKEFKENSGHYIPEKEE